MAEETKEVKPKVSIGRKPKAERVEKVKPIALEIICTPQTKDAEAEAKYYELMDERGGVTIKNPVCGGSMHFKHFELFPKVNKRCTCGRAGHYGVKYTFSK